MLPKTWILHPMIIQIILCITMSGILMLTRLQSNEWRKALDISWFLFCFVLFINSLIGILFIFQQWCLLHTNIIFFILFLVCLFVFNYGFLLTIQIINTISAMSANVIQISVLPLFEWAYFPLKCYLLYVKIE